MTPLTQTKELKVAPWVARKKSVPEALPIAQKLMLLSEAAEDIAAPEWNSPSTRDEVKACYQELGPLFEEVRQLMKSVIES